LLGASTGAGVLACSSPGAKPQAWDQELLAELTAEELIRIESPDEPERAVDPSSRWMTVDPEDLTFAGLRTEKDGIEFCLVLESDPTADRLVLFPLEPGETPLDALSDPERRGALRQASSSWRKDHARLSESVRVLSLREVVEQARLGPPLPEPRRILAVAANFPSHLRHDLDVSEEAIAVFRLTPPRVFQKHPPMPAPGTDPRPDTPFRGVIGPYDTVVFPDVVSLPEDERKVTHVVPTCLDYEVEVGIVLARRLTRADMAQMSDDDIWRCIAGYVLVSDIKARNPQVFERILARKNVPTEPEKRYLTGDAAVDAVIGKWDEDTCAWWSYAASQGDYSALGPFFVAASGEPHLRSREVLCARSYAPAGERTVAPPRGHRPETLYLRQCSRVTSEAGAEDGTLWSAPEIIRAILSPIGALDLGGEEVFLERGDVIALGTPGGIALTVTRSRLYRWLDALLFWWDALDWHNAFFRKDASGYLYQGDRVFLWGSGLGFQLLDIHRLQLPELPETVEDADAPEVAREAEREARDSGLDQEVEDAQQPAKVDEER
jgi:2-keto-4-pentenoate hydratase/2-oxohepta-3-ene-1,7-dioic acid hydratase in catechol pathway